MTSAKVYIQQKEYDQALVFLKKEIENNPTNAEAYLLAGQIYGEMDSLEQMVEMFAKAEELDSSYRSEIEKWRKSKSAEAFNRGIKAWKKKKDLEDALRWTLFSLKIDSTNVNAWKNLAFLYQEKVKRFESSGVADSAKYYDEKRFEVYKKAHRIAPDDTEILWILAGLYTSRGKPDSAIALLSPLIGKTDEPKVYFALADAYDAKADTQKALEMLTKAEALDPQNVDLLFDIGVRYYRMHNFDRAATYFGKVVERDSTNADALYNLSLSLFNAGDYDGAEAAALRLVKLDPNDADSWEQLAVVWAKSGKTRDAKTAMDVSKALRDGAKEEAQKLMEKLGIGSSR